MWDLATLVLGLNLWISFIVLPVIHLHRPPGGPLMLCLLGASLLALGIGIWLRHQVLLLLVFPLLLLLTTLAAPQLVSAGLYSFWTFCLVASSFLAYMLVIPLVLISPPPAVPTDQRDLRQLPLSPKWRRRRRIYRTMAALAAVFPCALLITMHLHPGVKQDLSLAYPGRQAEITALFGLLALTLWIGIFFAYFQKPLRAHVEGDPQMRYELQRLRRQRLQQHPRARFYVLTILALLFMVVLLLINHW